MKKYYVKVWIAGRDPASIYVVAGNKREAERKARAYIREWLSQWTGKEVKRLPNDTTIEDVTEMGYS